MFGLGVGEIIVILIFALIFIGPKKLPELAQSLGKGIKEFNRARSEIMNQVNQVNHVNFSREDFSQLNKKNDEISLTPPSQLNIPNIEKEKNAESKNSEIMIDENISSLTSTQDSTVLKEKTLVKTSKSMKEGINLNQ